MKKLLYLLSAGLLFSQLSLAQVHNLELSSYSNQTEIRATGSITLKPGFHITAGRTVLISVQRFPFVSGSPTASQNYILTRSFRTAVKADKLSETRTIDQENRTVQYFDGLGRPLQTVQQQASPEFRDIVQHVEYDGFGRQTHQYLPYADAGTSYGSYRSSAKANQLAYYGSSSLDVHVKKTTAPYAVTVFENSPLNRVLEQGAPGVAWQPATTRSTSGRTVVSEYGTNVVSTAESVKLWQITAANNGATGTSNYVAGRLYKTVLKDENWLSGKTGTVEEYKDFEDRVVLKRIWESETKKLDTYYVYDDLGNLRYVVPPAYTATSIDDSQLSTNSLVYAYRYDGRQRLIEKKIPSKGWEWIVYNQNDQPILSQDAVQRSVNQWSYTKYDAFGRVTETGIYTASHSSQSAAQTAVNNHVNNASPNNTLWDERVEALNYDNTSFPRSNKVAYVINYYDDYSFAGGTTADLQPSGITKSLKTKTLLTGTSIAKDDGSAPLLSIYYYDDRARLIQSASKHHLGGTDYVTNSYNFPGDLLSSTRRHQPSAGSTAITTIVTKHDYDQVGRLTQTSKKVNAQAEIVQSKLAYNEIGQLKQKSQHSANNGGSYAHAINYAYNERGWATQIGSPHFTQVLSYEAPSLGTTLKQYNGNISEQQWGHGTTNTPNRFVYQYDKLNRLTSGTSTGTVMSEALEYDDMGNIKTLKRDNGTTINYTYSGNQLSSLSGGLSGSYTYDNNGNAKTDRMGMSLNYNHLNLPRTASKTGTSVNYLYDAMGSKLRKSATVNGTQTQQDYIAGIEYSKTGTGASAIEMIHTEEGYLQRNAQNNTYSYHYNQLDHLGNVRATVQVAENGSSSTVIQKHDYYPFGKAKALVTGGINKYLYNGKEIQGELGGQYDYGARFYDAEIGRWNVVDPMAEMYSSYSPYAYVGNDPILFHDPNGMYRVDANGNITIDDQDEISSFLSYMSNNSGASINDMSNHIISAGNGFSWELDAVSVIGRNSFESGGWLTDAQGRVSDAVGLMGSINSVTTANFGFDRSKKALDYGGGFYGAFGTSVASGNQWLGKNGKYYNSSWGGNQYTGSRSAAYRAAGMYKWAGRGTVIASVLVGGMETYRGYEMDGGQFGYNAQRAAASGVGSIAGGFVGAQSGAYVGATIGMFFGGVGAVPGAIIGGFIGGVAGGYAGSDIGSRAVNFYHGR